MHVTIFIISTLFTYQGTVVLPHDPATGLVGISPTNGIVHSSTTIKMSDPPVLEPGQIVSVSGDIRREGRRTDRFITDVKIVGHGHLPTFTPITAKVLNSGKAVGQFVSFRGIVQDISRDDTDDRFVFASISDGDGLVFWAGAGKDSDRELFGLIGAEVEASGIAVSGDFAARRNFGPSIVSTSMKSLVSPFKAVKRPFRRARHRRYRARAPVRHRLLPSPPDLRPGPVGSRLEDIPADPRKSGHQARANPSSLRRHAQMHRLRVHDRSSRL